MTPAAEGKRPFDHIWEKVIQPVSRTVLENVDPDFAECCALQSRPSDEWKDGLYKAYQHFRKQLKDICYGSSDHGSPEERLDGRKIAAVLCASLISQKGFGFDMVKAHAFVEEKKRKMEANPVAFNQWAAGNVYLNYKLAYYASLQLVYLTLMRDLLKKGGLGDSRPVEALTMEEAQEREEAKKLAARLNEWGHLAPYPQPPRGDGFDVNIIIGLARTDISRKDLDMFMFAMQLYQIEERTVNLLE